MFIGGGGADTFVVNSVSSMVAAISDFMSGTDHIELSQAEYGSLFASGSLDASKFGAGADMTTAATATMRLFHDQTQGNLYYDQDGNGMAVAVKVATFSSTAKPALSAADFMLAA